MNVITFNHFLLGKYPKLYIIYRTIHLKNKLKGIKWKHSLNNRKFKTGMAQNINRAVGDFLPFS